MKTVITGATSMIGIAILEACLENGVERIYAVVRKHTSKLYRIPVDNRVSIIQCDMDEYDKLPELIPEQCDVFYHIAWNGTGIVRNQDILQQARNIQYTLEAVQVAKKLGCGKFIGAGSQAEYGKLDVERIDENSLINPVQPYGIAKYAAGKLASEEARKIDIDFFWVRIFSVYGKYDKPSTMISTAVSKLMAGQHTAFTAGEQRWDYLYSSDAGEAFYLIGEKAEGNKVYCLGSGRAEPLHEYIEYIGRLVAPGSDLGIGEISYTGGTVMNLCADITRLKKDTGWKPKVNFEEGIQRYIHMLQSDEKPNKATSLKSPREL